MNAVPLPFQLYVPLFLAVLMFSVFALAFLIAMDHGAIRAVRRVALGRELRKLRMERMLGMRGIARKWYLRALSIDELREQMERCRNCSHTRQCDEAHIMGRAYDPNFSYCPNTFVLNRLKLKKAGLERPGVADKALSVTR